MYRSTGKETHETHEKVYRSTGKETHDTHEKVYRSTGKETHETHEKVYRSTGKESRAGDSRDSQMWLRCRGVVSTRACRAGEL